MIWKRKKINSLHILLTFCLLTVVRSQAISPEFFYNENDLNKAKVLSSSIFLNNTELLFSYNNMFNFGIFYYYSKLPLQAEKYFFKALKLTSNPTDKANVNYWLGRNFLAAGKPEQATYYFNRTLSYNRNPPTEFLFYYATALYGGGKYEDALNCFLNFEAQTQNQYRPKELQLFIAASALGKEDFNLTNQILTRKDIQNNPDFYPIVQYLLGLNYYLTDDNKKSLNALKEITSDTITSEVANGARLISGAMYYERGEITKATKEFDAILNDIPNRFKDQAYLRAGISYYKLKQMTKAIERFDSLKQKYPNSQLAELAFYYKAKIYEQNQKWKLAKTEYRKFLASYPLSRLSEQVNINLGRILFLDENYIEAIPVLEDFLKNFPNSVARIEILLNVIKSYFALKRYNKTQVYGEQYIREFPFSEKVFTVHYILGQIGIIKNDINYALKHFRSITGDELYPCALKSLGDIYFNLDSILLSRNYYNLAEKVCKDTLLDDIRFNRQKVYFKLGQYESEVEMLKDYLQQYPQSRKSATIQYDIGQYYFNQGHFLEAIIEFDRVNNYSPTAELVPKVEEGKAGAYTKIGQISQAITNYTKIVNDFPSYPFLPRVIKSLASLYNSIQNYDTAIIFYNRLTIDFPKTQESENAFIELATTYRALGRVDESVKLLERFIVRYPESNQLREAYFELVDCYKDIGKFSLAEKNINEAFTKFDKSGDGYYKLGNIYNLQNKYLLAKANYLNAYDFYLKEQNQELAALSLFEAGKCAVLLKKWTEAKELFNQCTNTTQDERLRIECQNQLKLIEEK